MTELLVSQTPTRQHPFIADAVALQEVMAMLCLRDVTILANIEFDPVTQKRMTHYSIDSATFDDNRLADCGGFSYLIITLTSKFARDGLVDSSLDDIKEYILGPELIKGDPYQFMFCNLANVLAFNEHRMQVSFFELSEKIIAAFPGVEGD